MAKAKKKVKKKTNIKYVAIPKNWYNDPRAFKSKDEMFKDIESGDLSTKDFNFYTLGAAVRVEVKIIETTKKVTGLK